MTITNVINSCLRLGLFMTLGACVDRIYMNDPGTSSQLVVDGYISDEPGPYTVKLTRTTGLGGSLTPARTVIAKRVTLVDDLGNSEILSPIDDGLYQTSPSGMRGIAGREYFVRIETRDDKVFESIPEKILPSGKVDSIYYQFVSDNSDVVTKYGFNIFGNFEGDPNEENLFRWKFKATYRVVTHPELRTQTAGEDRIPWPAPCSGYIFSGTLKQVKPCTCCTCWPSLIDQTPKLSDSEIVSDGKFYNIQIGYVPVEYWTFFDKVRVEVRQLRLTQSAYNFWKTVRDQEAGGTSLFQPAIGKLRSNIFSKGGTEEVQGYFYAAGVSKKVLFIDAKDIPVGSQIIPPAPPPIQESCIAAFKNSTNEEPEDWK